MSSSRCTLVEKAEADFSCFCPWTDEQSLKPRKFLVDVEETMKLVLEREDTDGNFQVCTSFEPGMGRNSWELILTLVPDCC